MNNFFLNISKEERENILDKHKSVYDGYVTNYEQKNTQPLYVQDFANDKNGITVNNKGDVTEYKNVKINEMRFDGKSTGLFDEDSQSGSAYVPEETIEDVESGDRLDMIGDGEDDLDHGTFNDEESLDLNLDDDITNDDIIIKYINDDEEIDVDIKETLQEQVFKTLDMFKRFKKY